jgi:zinc protease
VAEIFKEVRGMVERPVSDDELKKAKDSLSNSLPGAFESSANAVSNFSNVFIYDLGLDYYTRYAEQVNAVTPDQTLAVAKKYLNPSAMVVVAVGDKAKIEPQLKQLNLGAMETRDTEGRLAKQRRGQTP